MLMGPSGSLRVIPPYVSHCYQYCLDSSAFVPLVVKLNIAAIQAISDVNSSTGSNATRTRII